MSELRSTTMLVTSPLQTQSSRLLTLRLWPGKHGKASQKDDSEQGWRIQITDVLNGESHYFNDWQSLLAYLQELLSKLDDPDSF